MIFEHNNLQKVLFHPSFWEIMFTLDNKRLESIKPPLGWWSLGGTNLVADAITGSTSLVNQGWAKSGREDQGPTQCHQNINSWHFIELLSFCSWLFISSHYHPYQYPIKIPLFNPLSPLNPILIPIVGYILYTYPTTYPIYIYVYIYVYIYMYIYIHIHIHAILF
jgi:hypothetical protein